MNPPQRSFVLAFSTSSSITGTISGPSKASNLRVSGLTSPRKIEDHTIWPKANTETVLVAISTDKAARGCPRNPGMASVALIVDSSSVHMQASSCTDWIREVDSYPEVAIPRKSSAGSGAFKSSIVRPRSETSTSL
eukprot:scaffold4554_cov178-Amphora_coffeaeformis.AAC.9